MTTVKKASERQQPDWLPPRTADGQLDWPTTPNRDPSLGFHRNHEEKREHEQRQAQLVADFARMEEAKARQAELKAGAPAQHRDLTFASRIPRDILRRAAPPRYDFEDVPRPIGEFAWHFSQATGYDPSGAIVAAVTTAASMIDDNYRLLVRPESDWHVAARQWAFLCGDPSTGKSPNIRAATGPVKKMHHDLYQRWRAVNEGERSDEQEPVPALYTSDSTIAALSVALQANPRGLLMLTEEFASWIGGIDSADRGESAKNRGDWLQLRDGGPHQINRVIRGVVYVPNWGVSVLAACTPDGLAKQMKQMPEDGLVQRFIPCILSSPDLDATGDARVALDTWGRWLEWAFDATTSYASNWLRLSDGARILFDAEVRQIRELVLATEAFSPAYAAHLGKHPGMLAEVALTFHVYCTEAGGVIPPEVSVEAMRYAIRYLRKARRHAHTLYSSILSSAPAFELARALARSIVASEPGMTTVSRDWMTSHCQLFRKADDRLRREAVQMLEDADWLSAETHARTYGGWPRSYLVHHKVFEMFAREGELWRARRAAVRDMIGEVE
jgi:Protein of unknown function (DUF3987)